MQRKAERMEKLANKFTKGMPLKLRSEKKEFKPKVVKKANIDQQTKDEKNYLGTELFTILQQAKKESKVEDDKMEQKMVEQINQ